MNNDTYEILQKLATDIVLKTYTMPGSMELAQYTPCGRRIPHNLSVQSIVLQALYILKMLHDCNVYKYKVEAEGVSKYMEPIFSILEGAGVFTVSNQRGAVKIACV